MVYKDPKASIEARVEDLLARMTIEDKASQLCVVKTPLPARRADALIIGTQYTRRHKWVDEYDGSIGRYPHIQCIWPH